MSTLCVFFLLLSLFVVLSKLSNKTFAHRTLERQTPMICDDNKRAEETNIKSAQTHSHLYCVAHYFALTFNITYESSGYSIHFDLDFVIDIPNACHIYERCNHTCEVIFIFALN